MAERRVVGPPGTGKTGTVARDVEKAVAAYGPERVLVTSLTRAAAAELGSRVDLPEEQMGTLHAHCFRALGRPDIAETPKHLKAWNESHPYAQVTISGGEIDDAHVDGQAVGRTDGDVAMNDYMRYRAMMLPREAWRSEVQAFAKAWEGWKAEAKVLDFTDLIETAFADTYYAPGHPSVIYVDEAQDHDRLELSLLRKWANPVRNVERLVVVGDPDQNLYEWRGSDPEAFSTPELPPEAYTVLSKSYRVPRAVHSVAVEWLRRSPSAYLAEYHPRDADGKVIHTRERMNRPRYIVEAAARHAREGETVMILTACAYQLGPVIRELREMAIPFANPYRASRGDWNPLGRPTNGIATQDRLLAYMRPLVTQRLEWAVAEIRMWAVLLAGVLRRGAKEQLDALDGEAILGVDEIEAYFREYCQTHTEPHHIFEAGDIEGPWIDQHAATRYRQRLAYLRQVARQCGTTGLAEAPRLIVGTIHSVKGGEADRVYLSPDVSMAAYEGIHSNARLEAAMYRQFYVGMTRTRNTLVLCAPSEKTAVRW